MAVLRCSALYLSNSTLAWQGGPGDAAGLSTSHQPAPLPGSFPWARSRSDQHALVILQEDLSIRPAGSLDYRNHTSRGATLGRTFYPLIAKGKRHWVKDLPSVSRH